jgi:hypothetical protein
MHWLRCLVLFVCLFVGWLVCFIIVPLVLSLLLMLFFFFFFFFACLARHINCYYNRVRGERFYVEFVFVLLSMQFDVLKCCYVTFVFGLTELMEMN